jgi:hypothetical protein
MPDTALTWDMAPDAHLVELCLERFGDEPRHPREIIEAALNGDAALFNVLAQLLPGFAGHAHPNALRNYLRRIENQSYLVRRWGRPGHYRFARHGHRWRVLETRILEKLSLTAA